MAEETEKTVKLKEGETVVSQTVLASILEKQAELEKQVADQAAKNAGLEELFAAQADTTGEKKLREKKTFEPLFRTVRLRKYPMAGDHTNMGFVIGWSSRGAYQKVDRSGVSPQIVDYLDVFFLDHEKNAEGKLQAEAVPLLALLNDGTQVNCRIIDKRVEKRKEPTGEEINVATWDPKHGLVETGDVIDGWVEYTDTTLVLQVPGREAPVEIDSMYVNR